MLDDEPGESLPSVDDLVTGQDVVLEEDTIVERKTSSTHQGERQSYRIGRKGQCPSASKWFSKEVGEAQFPHLPTKKDYTASFEQPGDMTRLLVKVVDVTPQNWLLGLKRMVIMLVFLSLDSRETVVQEDAGIEGIPHRLEKHRSLTFGNSKQDNGNCIDVSSKANDCHNGYVLPDVAVETSDVERPKDIKSQLQQMQLELSSSLSLWLSLRCCVLNKPTVINSVAMIETKS
ncbi:hypothetical protein Tco_0999282 [Tanacetum coccineum]